MHTSMTARIALSLFAALVVAAAAPAAARAHKLSCKKVRDALAAGHTLDQINAEFDTDTQHVGDCLQKRGRRRAAPKTKQKKSSSAPAQAHTSAPANAAAAKSSGAAPARAASRHKAP